MAIFDIFVTGILFRGVRVPNPTVGMGLNITRGARGGMEL